jgi:hypothetical protein
LDGRQKRSRRLTFEREHPRMPAQLCKQTKRAEVKRDSPGDVDDANLSFYDARDRGKSQFAFGHIARNTKKKKRALSDHKFVLVSSGRRHSRFGGGKPFGAFSLVSPISIKIKQHEMRNDMSLCVLSGLPCCRLRKHSFFSCASPFSADSCAKKPFNHFSFDGFCVSAC